jgi:capsule polysaccharide export protein KpsC/LpsZ
MLDSRHNIGIVKCSHCKKILASDEFDSHKCELELVGVKSIPVIYYSDVSYKDKKLINGWGVDGILYTLEVVPRKPIPIVMLSDDFLQRKKSDKDLTEPLNLWLECFWMWGLFLLFVYENV